MDNFDFVLNKLTVLGKNISSGNNSNKKQLMDKMNDKYVQILAFVSMIKYGRTRL